jgi:hypothetical protein
MCAYCDLEVGCQKRGNIVRGYEDWISRDGGRSTYHCEISDVYDLSILCKAGSVGVGDGVVVRVCVRELMRLLKSFDFCWTRVVRGKGVAVFE